MDFLNYHYQRNTSWNAPYTFSGKEKDVETGYGYFGARYYDSGLSIWLSVDPMSDKYPSMSPYNYCANNPVMLVDPDGRDYDVKVDEWRKTITISATYYTTIDHKDALNDYVKLWNDQSGNFEIIDENGVAYSIEIKLKVEGDYTDNEAAAIASRDSQGAGNFFDVADLHTEFKDPNVLGITYNGKGIALRSTSPNSTGTHEVGHTLGALHVTIGIMTPFEENTSNAIPKSNIWDIFNNAGQNVNCSDPGVGYTDVTTSNAKATWTGRTFSSNSTLREKVN